METEQSGQEQEAKEPGLSIIEETTLSLTQCEKDLISLQHTDPEIEGEETAKSVISILKRIETAITPLLDPSYSESHYHILHRTTIQIYHTARVLRKHSYSRHIPPFLSFAIFILQNNLILSTIKFLPWKLTLFTELMYVYEEAGAFVSAYNVALFAIKKVKYVHELELQDAPLPEATTKLFQEVHRVLGTMEVKYAVLSAKIKVDEFVKKINEGFNAYPRTLVVLECLQDAGREKGRILNREKRDTKKPFVKAAIAILNKDIEVVKKYIVGRLDKRKRDEEKARILEQEEKTEEMEQALNKFNELDEQMVGEKAWKEASNSVPLEAHIELIKYAYQCGLNDEFEDLCYSASFRLKFRRLEVPYLSTIDILATVKRNPKVPNGFEKVMEDLNVAHLKEELAQLRAKEKEMPPEPILSKEEAKKAAEKKKAEKPPEKPPEKAAAKKAPPPKKGAPLKKGQAAPAEEEKEEKPAEGDAFPMAFESELDKVDHTYIHILLQKTKNPLNAVCGFDLVFANPQKGPKLVKGEYAVAIPIARCQFGDPKDQNIPFIVFRRTLNSLKDEEDKLSIITDVKTIICKKSFYLAPLGYTKIPFDLRQNPEEVERLPNIEYAYLCFKTEKELRLLERDFEILKRFYDLERSIEEEKYESEAHKKLKLNVDLNTIVDLTNTIGNSLLGPVGSYYFSNRKDFLLDICTTLYKKYIEAILLSLDKHTEKDNQSCLDATLSGDILSLILSSSPLIKTILLNLHRLFAKLPMADPLLSTQIAIHAAAFHEESEEYRISVQILRNVLSLIVQYREDKAKRGVSAKHSFTSSMYVTCDNWRIDLIEKSIDQNVQKWETYMLRRERARERNAKGITALDEDEADEEQFEIDKAMVDINPLEEEKFDEKQEVDKKVNKLLHKHYSERDSILNALHADVLVNLYRCELKLSKQMKEIKNETKKMFTQQGIQMSDETKGVSHTLKQKMTIIKGKTATKVKKDFKNLEKTLQDAGKLRKPIY